MIAYISLGNISVYFLGLKTKFFRECMYITYMQCLLPPVSRLPFNPSLLTLSLNGYYLFCFPCWLESVVETWAFKWLKVTHGLVNCEKLLL